MKVAVFDTHAYDRRSLEAANGGRHALSFFEPRLTPDTVALARGFEAVCIFVNDRLDAAALAALKAGGTRLVALRCAGFNHVDVAAAEALGLTVARVGAYSPYAVAEHAVALLLCLNRKLHWAYARVREGNFSLDGLTGFDLHGRTVGVVGTGQIGRVFARIMQGFGCRVLCSDPCPIEGLDYVDCDTLYAESDVLSLHLPLTPATTHLIDAAAIARMKRGVILLNTSRGGLIDTTALIAGLKAHQIGGAALDVYEREAGVFFADRSEQGIEDDELARLLAFPNVLVTGHQAFLTDTALHNIAETTLENISRVEAGQPPVNPVTATQPHPPRV